MVYKRGSRFGLSEEKQSLIYWTCVNYKNMPDTIQHKIINLCTTYGGQYHQELFQAVTTKNAIDVIADFGYTDKSWLCKKVRLFYQNW